MSKTNNQILEWLLYNNENWAEVHNATLYSNVKKTIKEKSEKEVKRMLSGSGSWERNLIPVVSGKVCYLETPVFLEKKDIENSRKELKRWISDEVISTEKEGIVVNSIESRMYGSNIDGSEYGENRVLFPEIEVSYYKKNTRKIGIRTLKSMGLTSCLYFKPSIWTSDSVLFYKGGVIGQTKDEEEKIEFDKRSLINEQGELRHKIKESQDLYIDMCFSHISGVNFLSFNNFPDIVHGNFVMLDWDNIVSFEGFPKVCEKNVLMRNCRIPYKPHLPKNIEICGDLICNDCTNDYNLIYAILKYNWNIHGKIYTSVYTGSLEKLIDIATTNGWI